MGKELPVFTLDVFTEERFSGNPLAIVCDADALSEREMQKIAAEFNLPETVFVTESRRPGHTARVQIFTPKSKVPFAGHPTIGVAVLLADLRAPKVNGEQDALIVLEQDIGTVRVGVRVAPDGMGHADFKAPKLPQDAGDLPVIEKLAAALDLIPSEIGFENYRPTCFAAGNTFALLPIRSLDAIEKARIVPTHWPEAFEEQGLLGVYLYTRQCVHNTSAFHTRMFAPGAGIPEDAATGSAAVCLAGAVQRFDQLSDGVHRKRLEQGYELGRPSHIDLTIDVEGGALKGVRIGGSAVRVTKGQLTVE